MKKFINVVAWVIPVALLAWFAYTLIQNTKTQPQEKNQEIQITVNFNNKPDFGTETVETIRQVPVACPFSGERKTSEAKTIVKKTQSEPSERRVVITEDAFKETMQRVAYKAHKEAQKEYDKSFSTLLTILTIFGIAWPAIIALLQFKINEKAQENAQKSLEQSEGMVKSLIVFQKELYHLAAENYLLNACFWNRESQIGKQQNNLETEINGIRCSIRAYIKTIYYYAKAEEIKNANSYVRITIDLLDGLQRRSGVKKTQKISDIDWKLFLNLGIDNADEIKEKSETIFCKD